MRATGVVATFVAGCLLLSACSSGTDDGALELEPDEPTAAPASPDPTAEAPDEPTPPVEGQLYPPLPDLEPDPESDIPPEDQQFFLDLYGQLYEATLEANTTLETGGLEEVLAGDALEQQTASIEQMGREDQYLDSRDIETRWVRVVEVENGPAVVQECRVFGVESGARTARDDALVAEREAPVARLLQARFTLVEVEGGSFEYRATELVGADTSEECVA